MVRMLTIYFLILFACALTWYITKELQSAYRALKANNFISSAKPIFLILTLILFILASIQSFFETPDDIASHTLLIITTLLLSVALAINKASFSAFFTAILNISRRYYLKLKMLIAHRLIKFGKRK